MLRRANDEGLAEAVVADRSRAAVDIPGWRRDNRLDQFDQFLAIVGWHVIESTIETWTVHARNASEITKVEALLCEDERWNKWIAGHDREERPGVKFKDADLIGFPVRVVVGARSLREGQVEVSLRRDREKQMVPEADVVGRVRTLLLEA